MDVIGCHGAGDRYIRLILFVCVLCYCQPYLSVAYSVYARGFFCVRPTVQDTIAVCGETAGRESFPSTVS